MQGWAAREGEDGSDSDKGSKAIVFVVFIGKPLIFFLLLALGYRLRRHIRRCMTSHRRQVQPDRADPPCSHLPVAPLPAVWPGLLAPLPLTEVQNGDVCPFCLDDLAAEICASLPCSHCMHKDCFLTWYHKRRLAICPICLKDYTFWRPSPPDPPRTAPNQKVTTSMISVPL